MKTKIVRLVLGCLALFGLNSVVHAETWYRADTRHFIIHSNGSAKDLKRRATDLERFDSLMKTLLGIEPDPNPYRLHVYIVKDTGRVSDFVGNKKNIVAGFYRPSEEGTILVSSREEGSGGISGEIVLFHEYAHHLMYRYFTNAYPAWYREGFAEFLSTATFKDDGGFTLGAPANHRAFAIKNGIYMPLERLMFTPQADMTGQELGMFYAQSWVLTHYLQSSSELNGKMLTYFAMLSRGDTANEAATEVFGDIDKMEKKVESYGRGKILYRESNTPIRINGDIKVRTLNDLQSDLAKYDFYFRANHRPKRVLSGTTKLLAAHPENAEVHFQHARALWVDAHSGNDFDFSTAMASVEKAIALDPNHIGAHILKARIIMEPADHEEIADQVIDFDAVRDHLLDANKLDADDPMPLLYYVQSFDKEGISPPDIAIPAMQQVFGSMPEVVSVRTKLARLHASQGQYDEALNLVSFLVADPHHSKRGKKLVEEIESRRDGKKVQEDDEQTTH